MIKLGSQPLHELSRELSTLIREMEGWLARLHHMVTSESSFPSDQRGSLVAKGKCMEMNIRPKYHVITSLCTGSLQTIQEERGLQRTITQMYTVNAVLH